MFRGRSRIHVSTVLMLVAALALAGCGTGAQPSGPPAGPPPDSSRFLGTVAGDGVSGTLSLTLATATPRPQFGAARVQVAASGRFVLLTGGGATMDLTGSHDTATQVFSVTGGGWTFTGGVTSVGLEGGFTAPSATGIFTLLQQGAGADTVIVVTGSFVSGAGGPGGVFNLAVRGTAIHGNAWTDGEVTATVLDGTFTPATGAISIVNPQNPGGPPLATGVYDPGSGIASGDYDNGAGDTGTWSGTKGN